mmetsp:Transcript_23262/g.30375  ORF Transcript_23262/g.30375 Transcript_23262/m.30375 type:complete len:264 (+) Transcript_23262:429-1220(+)
MITRFRPVPHKRRLLEPEATGSSVAVGAWAGTAVGVRLQSCSVNSNYFERFEPGELRTWTAPDLQRGLPYLAFVAVVEGRGRRIGSDVVGWLIGMVQGRMLAYPLLEPIPQQTLASAFGIAVVVADCGGSAAAEANAWLPCSCCLGRFGWSLILARIHFAAAPEEIPQKQKGRKSHGLTLSLTSFVFARFSLPTGLMIQLDSVRVGVPRQMGLLLLEHRRLQKGVGLGSFVQQKVGAVAALLVGAVQWQSGRQSRALLPGLLN